MKSMSETVFALQDKFIKAFRQCDDDLMQVCVTALSESEDQKGGATILFRALLLRPWDGKRYDPKSWREEVRLALRKIYKLNELTGEDQISMDILDLFENPIEQLGPVHDLLIGEQKYCEWLAEYWKLIFEALKVKQADDIEILISLINELERHLQGFWTDINKERAQFGLQIISSFEDIVRDLNE